MIPAGTPSNPSIQADFLAPDNIDKALLVDYEQGGADLEDLSQGLNFQSWKLEWVDPDFVLTNGAATISHVLFSGNPTELTFTFDQNMRPVVAYMESDILNLRWYNPANGSLAIEQFFNCSSPVLTLDDKRSETLSTSDVILFYVKGEGIYYRQQRDRFLVEYLLAGKPPGVARITQVSMNRANRLQVYFKVLF